MFLNRLLNHTRITHLRRPYLLPRLRRRYRRRRLILLFLRRNLLRVCLRLLLRMMRRVRGLLQRPL